MSKLTLFFNSQIHFLNWKSSWDVRYRILNRKITGSVIAISVFLILSYLIIIYVCIIFLYISYFLVFEWLCFWCRIQECYWNTTILGILLPYCSIVNFLSNILWQTIVLLALIKFCLWPRARKKINDYMLQPVKRRKSLRTNDAINLR